jgi:hypothetical protein
MSGEVVKANFNTVMQIDVNPSGTASWQNMQKGWSNLTKSLNEVINQFSYFGDSGFGTTEVSGMQITLALTGTRYTGDTAQDYIFSEDVQYGLLDSRKTNYKITNGGLTLEGECTICNIVDTGGDPNGLAAISCEIHFNGLPTISGGVLGNLVVVSVEGTLSGDTAIYVNPALTETGYVYKTAASVDLPEYQEDLSSGWTAWNGTDDITATTGNEIVIAEVDGSDLAILAGRATVTSKA